MQSRFIGIGSAAHLPHVPGDKLASISNFYGCLLFVARKHPDLVAHIFVGVSKYERNRER